jgi:hypothetical protein
MDEFSALMYFAGTIGVFMLIIYPMLAYFFTIGEGEFLTMELITAIILFFAIFKIFNISKEAEIELLKKEKLSIIMPGRISDDKSVKTFNHRGVIISYVIRDSVIIRK